MSNTYSRDESGEDLASLALRINESHGKAETGLKRGLADAIEVGEALIEAQNRVQDHAPGTWLAWVKEHLTFDIRTAQRYIRLANYWREERKNTTRMSHFGVVEALDFISDSSEADDGFDNLSDAEKAALIGEEEEEALADSEARQGKREEESEARKLERKMKTLARIAKFMRKRGHERLADLIEAALAEDAAAEEVAAEEVATAVV